MRETSGRLLRLLALLQMPRDRSGAELADRLEVSQRTVHLGADTPAALAWMVTAVDIDFTLTSGPPELVEALRVQAHRGLRAIQ